MATDVIKMALRTNCIENVKLKIIKIMTGCQYVGYFYNSENLNWAAQNLRLGRGLDIAALNTPLLATLQRNNRNFTCFQSVQLVKMFSAILLSHNSAAEQRKIIRFQSVPLEKIFPAIPLFRSGTTEIFIF